MSDEHDEDGFEDESFEPEPLDEHETAMIEQDLSDLADFESAFRPDGYRGVAVWCQDCVEEHYYPWDMLRENLTVLIETGETPVHEPAFAPEPEHYVPWDYARGYVDALRDAGVDERVELVRCHRCGLELGELLAHSNFCPRCGSALLAQRLREALRRAGIEEEIATGILRAVGIGA